MSLVGLWSGAATAASIWANVTITHASLLSQYSLNPDNVIDKFKESPTWKWINSVIPAPANDFGNGFASSFVRAPSKKPVTPPTRTFDNLDLDDTSTTSYPITTDHNSWFAHAPSPARTTPPWADSPVTQILHITSTAPPVGYTTMGRPTATTITSQPGAASRHAAPLAFVHLLGADGLEVDQQEPDSPEGRLLLSWGARVYLGIAAACIIVISVSIGAHKIFNKEPYAGCPTQEPVVVINMPNTQYRVMLDASGEYTVIASAREDATAQGSMNYGPDDSCFFCTADGIPRRVLFQDGSMELPPSFMVSPDISLAHETMWESTPVKKSTQPLLPRTPTRTRTSIAHERLLVDELLTTSKPSFDCQHSDSLDPVPVAQVQNAAKQQTLPVELLNPSSSSSSPKLRRLNAIWGSYERSNTTRYSTANHRAIRTKVERTPKTPTVPRTIIVPATPPNEHISSNIQASPVQVSSHSVVSSNLSVCTLPIPAFPSDQMLNRVELPSIASLSPSPVRPQRRATLSAPTSIASSPGNSIVIPNASASFISQWPLPPTLVALTPSPTRHTRPTRQTADMHLIVNSPMPTFVSDMTSLMRDELPSITWSLSPSPVRPARRHKRNRVNNSELATPRAPVDHKDVFQVGLEIQSMNNSPDTVDRRYVNIKATITESPVKRKQAGHLLPQIGFPLDVSIVVDRSFILPSCPSSELIARLELPSFASSGFGFAPLSVGCDERLLTIPKFLYRPNGNTSTQSFMIPSCSSANLLTRVEPPSFASSQSSSCPAPAFSAAVRHTRQSSGKRFNPIPPTPPSLKRILSLIRPSDQSLVIPSCNSSEMLTRIELPSMASHSSAASAVSLYARNHSPALAAAYKLRELFDRSASSSRSGTPRPSVKPMSGPGLSHKKNTNRLPVRFTEANPHDASFFTESSLKVPTCPSSDMLTRVSLPDSSSLLSTLHSRDWSVQSTSLLLNESVPWSKESENKEISWASNV